MVAAAITAFHRGMSTATSVQTLVMWLLVGAAVTTAVVACLLGLPLLHRVQQASDGVIAPFLHLPPQVKTTMTLRAGRQFQSLRRLLRQAEDDEAGDTSSGEDDVEGGGARQDGEAEERAGGRSIQFGSFATGRADGSDREGAGGSAGLAPVPSYLNVHNTARAGGGGADIGGSGSSWLRTRTSKVVPLALDGAVAAASSSRSDGGSDAAGPSAAGGSACGRSCARLRKGAAACGNAARGQAPLLRSWLRFTGPAWLVLGAVIVVYVVTAQEVAALRDLLVVAVTAASRTTCTKEAWMVARKLQAAVAPAPYRHALFWMAEDLVRW
jgi:hypothetical protein